MRIPVVAALAALAALTAVTARADDARLFVPQLLGAQYTFVDQHQYALRSPYSGPLSLKAAGDTEQSHTFGAYFGVQLPARVQFYFDVEMFKGAGVSGATGLAGLTNGDVIRSGVAQLGKRAYVARRFLRWTLPLDGDPQTVERAQDQLPGSQAARRIEVKLGKMAVNDDFDRNRYANSTRTQFMNWTLRNGIYQMPTMANGQTLEAPLQRARGEQAQLTVRGSPDGWAMRLLVYRNLGRMGIYRDALAIAEATGHTPDIVADDHDGRRKYGYAIN